MGDCWCLLVLARDALVLAVGVGLLLAAWWVILAFGGHRFWVWDCV